MSDHETNIGVDIGIEQVWMVVANPDLTMDEAVAELEALGNVVYEVDETNRRIRVSDP